MEAKETPYPGMGHQGVCHCKPKAARMQIYEYVGNRSKSATSQTHCICIDSGCLCITQEQRCIMACMLLRVLFLVLCWHTVLICCIISLKSQASWEIIFAMKLWTSSCKHKAAVCNLHQGTCHASCLPLFLWFASALNLKGNIACMIVSMLSCIWATHSCCNHCHGPYGTSMLFNTLFRLPDPIEIHNAYVMRMSQVQSAEGTHACSFKTHVMCL